uniref:Major facilitator superfamily (MFS) profile domain-containing protein n=1 Tax=Ananas comosus var. bracteatus TaxID=296719 RepID=A0A6V7Q2M6_ANACO|nr:unnamed protein product [Ananas comosus var. bracteatus]
MSEGYAYLVLVMIGVYRDIPAGGADGGQSITVAVSFLFTCVVAQTFLAMLCRLKAGIFFFFGGWLLVMTAFVYLLLPETKNLPIEQIGLVWREHWFWKRIVAGGDPVGEAK